jgi:hypothetical protein
LAQKYSGCVFEAITFIVASMTPGGQSVTHPGFYPLYFPNNFQEDPIFRGPPSVWFPAIYRSDNASALYRFNTWRRERCSWQADVSTPSTIEFRTGRDIVFTANYIAVNSGQRFGISSEVIDLLQVRCVDPSDIVSGLNCLSISKSDAESLTE